MGGPYNNPEKAERSEGNVWHKPGDVQGAQRSEGNALCTYPGIPSQSAQRSEGNVPARTCRPAEQDVEKGPDARRASPEE